MGTGNGYSACVSFLNFPAVGADHPKVTPQMNPLREAGKLNESMLYTNQTYKSGEYLFPLPI